MELLSVGYARAPVMALGSAASASVRRDVAFNF
jgi:hypothetical protein